MKKINIWSSGSAGDLHERMCFEVFIEHLREVIKAKGFEPKNVLVDVDNERLDRFTVDIYGFEQDLTPKQKALNKLNDEDKKALGLI